MFGPTNPVGLEWLLPRSLKMIVYQLLGLLAPAPPPDVMPPIPAGVNLRGVQPLSRDEIRAPEEGEA